MDKNIYHVPYVYGKMDGRGTVSVRVQGSKSSTKRVLLMARLVDGTRVPIGSVGHVRLRALCSAMIPGICSSASRIWGLK